MNFNKQLHLFKALSDENRLQIFLLLAKKGPLCVGDIQDRMRIPQPSVSRALSNLRNAQLVVFRKQKNQIFYSVNTGHPALESIFSITGMRFNSPRQLSLEEDREEQGKGVMKQEKTEKMNEAAPVLEDKSQEIPENEVDENPLKDNDDDFLL